MEQSKRLYSVTLIVSDAEIAQQWPDRHNTDPTIGVTTVIARALADARAQDRERIAELEKGLAEVLGAVTCDCLHHKKSERHKSGEPCPVRMRLLALSASQPRSEEEGNGRLRISTQERSHE